MNLKPPLALRPAHEMWTENVPKLDFPQTQRRAYLKSAGRPYEVSTVGETVAHCDRGMIGGTRDPNDLEGGGEEGESEVGDSSQPGWFCV